MKRIFFLLLIIIPFQNIKSQNITVRAFVDSIFNHHKYWKDKVLVKQLQDSSLSLYYQNQLDTNAIVLIRYYLYGRNTFGEVNDSAMMALENLVVNHQQRFQRKNLFFYSNLASCYNYLGMISQTKNKFSLAKKHFESGLVACNSGLANGAEFRNSSQEVSLLTKKTVLFNNLGYLIYQSTNHKDPIDKRNEVGPIIEKYWLKADSIENLLDSTTSDRKSNWYCASNSLVVHNLLVLYGYYYPNELLFTFYYNKLIEQSKVCETKKALDQTNISLGWITFCREDYSGCVPFFLRYLRTYPDEKSNFVQDARYALTESYYHLGKPDSVIYYGNSYFKDTTNFKDYLFLSMSSMYMTEMYLQIGNIDKAKEHLKLSKEFMAKSQHEAFIREYKKEGEQIMMQAAIGKIAKLSGDIEARDQNVKYIKLAALVILLLSSMVGIYFFTKRLRKSKISKPDIYG